MPAARCTCSSSNLRPIRRLTAKTVFCGLVIAWRLAIWPTSRSPSSAKATIEGVVRLPSRLGSTAGTSASTTATQLFVVPRSMPRILRHDARVCRYRRVLGAAPATDDARRTQQPVVHAVAALQLARPPSARRPPDPPGAPPPRAPPGRTARPRPATSLRRRGGAARRASWRRISSTRLQVVGRAAGGERPLEVVDHRQEVAQQLVGGVAPDLLALALGALAVVVEVGQGAHRAVAQVGDLAAQRLDLLLSARPRRRPSSSSRRVHRLADLDLAVAVHGRRSMSISSYVSSCSARLADSDHSRSTVSVKRCLMSCRRGSPRSGAVGAVYHRCRRLGRAPGSGVTPR